MDNQICRIFLYNNKCIKIAETIIDSEDYYKVKPFKWHINNKGYAVTTIITENKGKKILHLHHFILKPEPPLKPFIDHANRNKLDNRKSNLRVCSQTQNSANAIKPRTNKSGFKGVSWDKKREKWCATIGSNMKMIRLGWFDNKKTAAFAYNVTAEKLHGEFARLNQVF